MKDPDRVALSFLKRLAINQKSTKFTFQTFDDDKTRKTKRKTLNRIINAKGAEVKQALDELRKLNERGAGIFVCVNETNLKGRKKADIKRIRTIFQEDDHGHGLVNCPLDPHIVVETSPKKFHRYWLTNSIDLDEFNSIQQTMVDHYGSDPQAKDISRVLRVPGFLHQKDPGHPFEVRIISMSDSPRYKWDEIKEHFTSFNIDDHLIFGRGGQMLCEIATIQAAVERIDPDEDYDTWLKVGMALHHESAGGQDGLNVFNDWSQKGGKYQQGDCETKWDSFSANPRNVTVNTLYKLARERGWDGLPSCGNSEERQLLYVEQKRIFKRFNAKYRLCMIEGSIRFVARSKNQIGNISTQFFKPYELKMYNDDYLHIPKLRTDGSYEVKRVNVIDHIINPEIVTPNIKKYEGIKFEPVPGLIATIEMPDEADEQYNLYCGYKREPKQGEWLLIKKHIFEILVNRNKRHFNYILDYLAHMIQKPTKRPGVVIVFKSEQGAGKNVLLDEIVKMYGDAGAIITDREEIIGNFNSGIAHKMIMLLDEAVWGGEKKRRSILKGLVTGEFIRVNEKNVPRFTTKNYSRVIFTTNDDFIAPIEKGDRRFFTPVVDDKYCYKFDHENREKYFKALRREIAAGGICAMFYDLAKRDISKFHPMKMPKNHHASKAVSVISSLSSVEKWVFNCLYRGYISDDSETKKWEKGGFEISTVDLYYSYSEFCREINYRGELESQYKVSRDLRNILGADRQKKRIKKNTTWMLGFYNLHESRSTFENYLGTSIRWEDSAEIEDLLK